MKIFFEAVFPMYANHIYNKKIHDKIDNFVNDTEYNEGIKLINNEVYKEQYSETFKIKDKLEDKAKTNVIGITITITLILGSSGIINSIYDKYSSVLMEWLVFGILFAAVTYMIFAGILAIQVLIADNKMYFVSGNTKDDEQVLSLEYKNCTRLNQFHNIIRNNSIFTSYECIRNALFCLLLIFIFITVPVNNTGKVGEKKSEVNIVNYKYEFLYSTSAIDFIKMNDFTENIEDIIIENIENRVDLSSINKSIGIADNVNNIYIKYKYIDNSVEVLLIELINNSINP